MNATKRTEFWMAETVRLQLEIERLEGEQCQAYSYDGKCDLVETLKAEIERLREENESYEKERDIYASAWKQRCEKAEAEIERLTDALQVKCWL